MSTILGCWGGDSPEYQAFNLLQYRPSSGFWGFVFWYPIFMCLCFKFAWKNLRAGDTLLCVDLETIVLSIFAAKFRKARIHFDVADPFYLVKPVPFKWFWKRLEGCYMRCADILTAPHLSRFKLFFDKMPKNAVVVENVPDIFNQAVQKDFYSKKNGNGSLTFGYFGTLDSHRGLEDLIQLVKTHTLARLVIGGRGSLTEFVKKASAECSRIDYVGEFQQAALPSLVESVDVYCSLYYLSKPLHRFAAPNKYFEHLLLGIPVIISSGTPYSDDVLKNGTGWVVHDGLFELENWFQRYKDSPADFQEKAFRARKLWDENYSSWMIQQQKIFRVLSLAS